MIPLIGSYSSSHRYILESALSRSQDFPSSGNAKNLRSDNYHQALQTAPNTIAQMHGKKRNLKNEQCLRSEEQSCMPMNRSIEVMQSNSGNTRLSGQFQEKPKAQEQPHGVRIRQDPERIIRAVLQLL